LGLGWSAAAVATFVLALVSRFKFKDRAAVVVVAMVLGGMCTILAAFELVEVASSILR
jgi:succinate-acetate transporter protein